MAIPEPNPLLLPVLGHMATLEWGLGSEPRPPQTSRAGTVGVGGSLKENHL